MGTVPLIWFSERCHSVDHRHLAQVHAMVAGPDGLRGDGHLVRLRAGPRHGACSYTRCIHKGDLTYLHLHSTQTLTFVVFSLCEHPEYIEPLRAEIEGPAGGQFLVEGEGLPLMDSFLKECSRWTPVESGA